MSALFDAAISDSARPLHSHYPSPQWSLTPADPDFWTSERADPRRFHSSDPIFPAPTHADELKADDLGASSASSSSAAPLQHDSPASDDDNCSDDSDASSVLLTLPTASFAGTVDHVKYMWSLAEQGAASSLDNLFGSDEARVEAERQQRAQGRGAPAVDHGRTPQKKGPPPVLHSRSTHPADLDNAVASDQLLSSDMDFSRLALLLPRFLPTVSISC
jgi:hypothetical protein